MGGATGKGRGWRKGGKGQQVTQADGDSHSALLTWSVIGRSYYLEALNIFTSPQNAVVVVVVVVRPCC